jgi:hypothetical protein
MTHVVDVLLKQHDRIRELFAEVETKFGEQRQEAFSTLRRLLAVHETAEEMIVHPFARHHVGNEVIDARLSEEHAAKQALSDLDGMEVNDPQFGTQLQLLKGLVFDHAAHEESDEFDRLREELGSKEAELMGAAVLAAEAVAPTHPHPGVESATANVVAGPVAALVDRTRDAITAVMNRNGSG